jgi:hypothetical protein
MFRFLGVKSDEVPLALKETQRQSDPVQFPMYTMIANYEAVQFAFRHVAEVSPFLCRPGLANVERASGLVTAPEPPPPGLKWALLLPICSRGSTAELAWSRIETFYNSLAATVPVQDLCLMHVIVGIDKGDVVFDRPEALARLQQLLPNVLIEILDPRVFSKKICRIWTHLAKLGLDKLGCDFFLLVGDDVEFLSADWKSQIETQFQTFARERQMPFGAGALHFP